MNEIKDFIIWKEVGEEYYDEYDEEPKKDREPFCCEQQMIRLAHNTEFSYIYYYCKKCGSYLKIYHQQGKFKREYFNPIKQMQLLEDE